MLAVITSLTFSLLLHSTNSCSTPHDSYLKQRTINVGECKCREYIDVYATCYEPFGCYNFPRNFQTSLGCFKLQTTGVKEIIPGDLGNLTHLVGLYISANKDLVTIEKGVFKNMKNLLTLSISFNDRLSYLDEDVFEGLENLETLTLTRNGFKDLKHFSKSLKTSHMPKLKTINLKEIDCAKVGKNDFANLNGSRVMNITFDNSEINYIDSRALIPLRNLKNLSVRETLLEEDNLIEVLEKLDEEGIFLLSLNIQGWGFKMKPPKKLIGVIANTTIKELILNKNQMHIIDENTFTKIEMPHIETLNIEESIVIDVRQNAFSNFPKLKQLHLRKNKLVFVPEGVLLPTIELLDISYNTIVGISYLTLIDNRLSKMSSLKKLYLNNNNVRKIFNVSFIGLYNLQTLNLRHCNVLAIANDAFIELKNLEYLDLGENSFPQRTFEKEIFNGLTNLKYLSLESCLIDHLPSSDIFGHLKSLETLNMDKNNLMEITPEFVTSLRTLKALNVASNKIKLWHRRLFENTSMENLTIFQNTFTYLTVAMLEDISKFKMINVANNPFHCDCDHLVESFTSLTQSTLKHILNLLNETSTFCLLPETVEYSTIVNYVQNYHNDCYQDKINKLMHYVIPSIFITLILLSAITLSYIYRWHIRYWMFLTKLAISKQTQFKRRETLRGHTNYLYDAFVSYSTEDRNFVIKLVDTLENYEPYLKLCVYERDFEIGTIISESVLESLSRSRKTLLIISNSYIKSQWCTWEAQVAENHRLFFEKENGECVNDSLIMIKLGNISSGNISPMLRYLMKTRVYLQWDSNENKQQQFWEKLRNVLAPALDSIKNRTIDVKL